jgi:hypothetical protein
MTTITVDILNDKALNLLKGLEALNVIKLHDNPIENIDLSSINSIKKLKGMMTKQSIEEIEQQYNDMRNEWN